MPILTSLLVGSHFHPPAKALLEHLPQGAPLILRREPDNPYDPNAIEVLLQPQSIPESQHGELGVKLPGMGFDLADVLQSPSIILGHVAATGGKPLLQSTIPGLVGNLEFLKEMEGELAPAVLGFDGGGRALIVLQTEEEGEMK